MGRLLKPKSGGNKLAQHQLCFSKRKQGCSSPNQVETSLLNINYAFPRENKVAQAQIRLKQACSTSIMLFQEETTLLKPKSGGNKLAQHQLCFSKRKQRCSSLNQVETSLLNINYAFPRGNKVAQAQIRRKQACSTSIMLFQGETRLLKPKSGGNKVAQAQIRWKQACSTSSRFLKWQQGSGNNLAQLYVEF